MKFSTRSTFRRSVLLAALLLPSLGEAVSFVKSVEYVEVSLGSADTTQSVNLTKGQVVANSVPFASMMMSGVDNNLEQAFSDVFFQTGPPRVTAQRQAAGGTLSLGVFVVEFDPAFVRVQQNTFSMGAGVASTTAAIAAVNLTKAALVSYYRHSATTDAWSDIAVAGRFSLANQLSWQRDTTSGAVNGHYFVFEALNSEFSVTPVSFTVGAGAPTGTATIAAVDMDKSLVIASYRTAYASSDSEDGQLGVFLANPTTVQAQRAFENSSSNEITDLQAFVVQFADNVRVQRGILSYADTDTQKTATIRSVDLSSTVLWNGSSIGPGTTENEATSSVDGDTAFHRLKLQNATTVRGDRDGTCSGTDCEGIGHFEVVEFNPIGRMLVKSGSYTGNSAARSIYVGFQPDVVFVKRDDTVNGVVRTSSMVGDATKSLGTAGVALFANGVQSLDSQGFTVGTHAQVNLAGQTYHWVAFQAAPGELVVGSYTGTNTDNRSILGVGFQPEYVITLPEAGGAAGVPVHRSSTMSGDTSYDFDSTEIGPPANAIQALEADGFQIGNASFVNTISATYHYIAWNAVPGRMAVGSYAGDGLDDRNLDVTGFQPEWVLVKRAGDSQPWVQKPASTGLLTDYSLFLADFAGNAGDVQQLRPLGFQVGFGPELPFDRTNESGVTYHWVAFGPHAPQVNYRSIGTAAAYGTGTIAVTNGSVDVTGTGTAWIGVNRGRGDVLTVPCTNPPTCTGGVHYPILQVSTNADLKLATPYTGATNGSISYLIRRQFTTLAAWETCIDGNPCGFFPVGSTSLVNDDRSEVGIAYKDSVLARVTISGSITDATHTITLTADPGNRHLGVAGGGVVVDGAGGGLAVILIQDEYVTVEWLEVRAPATVIEGVEFESLNPGANKGVFRNLLIHDMGLQGILIDDATASADVSNTIVYNTSTGIRIGIATTGTVRIFNNTVSNNSGGGITASGSNPTTTLRNNIAHSNAGAGDFSVAGLNSASSHNLASNGSGTTHSPAGGGQNSVPLASMAFVSTTPGLENLHIQAGSAAQDTGTDLSGVVFADIDGGARFVPWDIGADDIQATTEVELSSFEARALDGGVLLSWETGSELKNLGFHLYRGSSSEAPSERITSSLIPGLGSSPSGAKYQYRDAPLPNGTTYFYWLEDVETTGRIERHGPVSAAPARGALPLDPSALATSAVYGAPSSSIRVVSSTSSQLVLELVTQGFQAFPEDGGTVRIEIPGFVHAGDGLGLPRKRHWLEAVAGRKVEILSLQADGVERLGLRPSSETSEIEARRDGTQRLRRTRNSTVRAPLDRLLPEEWARIASVAFQGNVKKALLELSPLRWDGASEELLFARRLTVTIRFHGRELDEISSSQRRRGHRTRTPDAPRSVAARLAAKSPGLHGVPFEAIFSSSRRRPMVRGTLRLSRLGEPVAFHIEPDDGRFAPGSTLYFVSDGPAANPYGNEAVYELEIGASGEHMPVVDASPAGKPVGPAWTTVTFQQDRYYQAALLDAPDLWLWDILLAPTVKSFPFTLSALASARSPAKLEVFFQGASDFPESPDHHVRIFVNGTLAGEDRWNGKAPRAITVDLLPGILKEGENSLELENVGDTGALYSLVFLDRFTVNYSKLALAEAGAARGTWTDSGTATIGSFRAPPRVVDVSSSRPRWLVGTGFEGDKTRFRVEAGRSYLVVDEGGVARAEVRNAHPRPWKKTSHRADYVAIGPVELLEAARPLLDHRRAEGLRVLSVPIDEVFDEFGYGERRPEAVREFLSFAYHHWEGGIRYVLLLGDASYDFKDHLGTGASNAVPALFVKTSLLWTASDPGYAAVNGDDLLPDLAIGRLPADDAAELRIMVEKILAYERGSTTLRGPVTLVTDDADLGGNFDADARALESSVLAGRSVRRISLAELGVPASRLAILEAFDEGASIVSYMGHGGIHLWASENLFSNDSVALLAPQAQQPVALMLNCLNGYFHFPYFDSLAEELLKAEGRGAIAAFAPSGLSWNAPAHALHQSLLEELLRRENERLGDAVLRAQERFLERGSLPELLAIYNLLGDPALRLR